MMGIALNKRYCKVLAIRMGIAGVAAIRMGIARNIIVLLTIDKY